MPRRRRGAPILRRAVRRLASTRSARAPGSAQLAAPPAQLRALRPDLEVVELRGNVDTRLRKLAAGESTRGARAAGLERLGRAERPGRCSTSRAGRRARGRCARGPRGDGRGARGRGPQRRDRGAASRRARPRRARSAPTATPGRRLCRARARRRGLRHSSAARRLGVADATSSTARPRGARRGGGRAAARRRRRGGPGDDTARVYLVGAGPGDPGLLTRRAREVLATRRRDPPDKLIPPRRWTARAGAEVIDVGKDRRRRAGPPGGDQPAAARARARRADGRAAQGRRPVRLRPRRRGGLAAARARHPVRGRPRRHRGRRRARLRGHPRHPARARAARWRSSPATRIRRGANRSTGRRWPRFPGRSSSTWACERCRRSPSGWSPAAARPTSPRRSSSAARSPTSARSSATLATSPRAAAARSVRAPSITVVGPVAALGEQLAWLGAAPSPAARSP